MNIYDYSIPKPNGEELKLADYKGRVMLIVNTATGCGFTPQYEALEQIYEKYHDKGLEIIDIPCNQFGHQTPGTDKEVHEFCQLHYHTKFAQMKKSDVNGINELPLYKYLKSQKNSLVLANINSVAFYLKCWQKKIKIGIKSRISNGTLQSFWLIKTEKLLNALSQPQI